MTETRQYLEDIRQMIADNPCLDQRKVHRVAQQIRDLIGAHGIDGRYALVLVGAEFAASE